MSHGSSLNIPGWCQSSLLGDNSDGAISGWGVGYVNRIMLKVTLLIDAVLVLK